EWNSWTTTAAVRNGRMDILQYAHMNGCAWDVQTCKVAMECGNECALEYMHRGRMETWPCHWNICDWVKKNDIAWKRHLDTYQRTIDDEIRWSESASIDAFRSGNLDMLRYVTERGAPWAKELCTTKPKTF